MVYVPGMARRREEREERGEQEIDLPRPYEVSQQGCGSTNEVYFWDATDAVKVTIENARPGKDYAIQISKDGHRLLRVNCTSKSGGLDGFFWSESKGLWRFRGLGVARKLEKAGLQRVTNVNDTRLASASLTV